MGPVNHGSSICTLLVRPSIRTPRPQPGNFIVAVTFHGPSHREKLKEVPLNLDPRIGKMSSNSDALKRRLQAARLSLPTKKLKKPTSCCHSSSVQGLKESMVHSSTSLAAYHCQQHQPQCEHDVT